MAPSFLLYIFAFLLLIQFLTGNLPPILAKLVTDPPIGISFIIGLVVGITIHEASHAFVAYRLGDPTAKLEGRMTLDPRSHLDPIGTMALLFLGFGWGKPTPFDPYNLRNIKRDSAAIAASGAVSNFILALVLSAPYLIAYYTQNVSILLTQAYSWLAPIIWLNVILGVFNLIPVHPLDGFKVLAGILPRNWYEDFMQMEKFGIFILLILLFTGVIGQVLLPISANILGILIPGVNFRF